MQDWAFSCGHCHAGGGQLEYDRDRNDYGSAGEGSGDFYYFKPPTLDDPIGGITATHMSGTNKAEVDCLLCHLHDSSNISGNGRAFLNSIDCAGRSVLGSGVQLGPINDPYCAYQLAPNGTDPALTDPNMMGRNGAGMYLPGTKYDSFNRTLAIQDQQFNLAASLGIGAKASLSMAPDGHLHITGISGVPSTISAGMIQGTPNSQNCTVCHGRDDNTPGLPGMLNPVRYGYGIYLIINPKSTVLDVDPGSLSADNSNPVRWMELGCKTGMGKRGDKTGAGPNDKWGMSMFSAMFGLGIMPGTPITDHTYTTQLGPLVTKAKMPDQDVHDAAGMQCATCHYGLGSSILEGGAVTIPAATDHGVAYPQEVIQGIDHNFAQGDSLKDAYGTNHIDGTVSCESCHVDNTHPRYFNADGTPKSVSPFPPTPTHSSFPALHLAKIGCTTCHIPEIYIQPFKLKYRDFTAGKFKRGTEAAGGNRNVYDFSYDFVTASGDSTKQLHQWAHKYGETKIYPVTPIEVPNWISVINNWTPGTFGTSATSRLTTSDPLVLNSPGNDTGVDAANEDPANNDNTTIFNLDNEPNAIKTCQSGVKVLWTCNSDADCPGYATYPDMNMGATGIPGACRPGNAANVTPSMARDIIDVAAAAIADGSLQGVRINGGSMAPVFDNWVLTDNLAMDTIAKRNAMRAKSATMFSSDSSKQLKLEKIFHASFDETHGVAPKEWALGATERGGCLNCHSSAQPYTFDAHGMPNGPNPNYSPYSVGFFEGLQPYTERATPQFAAGDVNQIDNMVPMIGAFFVGKFDLIKNPVALFADFDCAKEFCGANTCGGSGCSTQNVYGVAGLDMLGSMLHGMTNPAGMLDSMFPLTPDSYYFNQMTGNLNDPNAACSPNSLLSGMGITTIGQCTALMNAGFDAMMGMPHTGIDATHAASTAGMMGFNDGIAGLQGLFLRETQDGTSHGCNPMAGMKSQADALGFPVNVNNCMPSPTFVAPTAGMIGFDMPVGQMFAGQCTGAPLPGSPWPHTCASTGAGNNGGFRAGQACAVNADCQGSLPDSEALFQFGRDPFGSLGSLMYTRAQSRTHNKVVLQSNGPLDLTWPIFAEKNPDNPAHAAGWDQAARCLTNYGFMGPDVPCGMTGTGYCVGQDGTSADKCVNVKTYISANDLLGFTSTQLAHLMDPATAGVAAAANFTWTDDSTIAYKVNFNAGTSTCPSGAACTYSWDFGDSTTGTGITTSRTYSDATPRTVTLTLNADSGLSASVSHMVAPVSVNQPPVAVIGTVTTDANTWTVSFTDASTDDAAFPTNAVRVTWGDGYSSTGNAGAAFSHTYTAAGTYPITLRATDAGGLSNSATASSGALTAFTITGTVTGASPNVNNMLVSLKSGTTVVANTYTPVSGAGTYTFTNVKPGTYTVVPFKTGVTLTPASGSVSVGPSATVAAFAASVTATTKYSIAVTTSPVVSGATITVKNSSGTIVAQGTTNAGGAYTTATTLSAGTYSVQAYKYGVLNSTKSVAVSSVNTPVSFP